MTARRLKWLSFVPEALLLFLTGCGGSQSVLNPQGIQAIRLAKLFWIFTGVCGAVWILVLIAMMIAVSGRRAEFRSVDPLVVDAQGERTMTIVVGSLVTLTALILIAFTFLSYLATRGLAAPGEALASRSRATNGGGMSNTKAQTPHRSSTPPTSSTCPSAVRSRSISRQRTSSIAFGCPTSAASRT